MRTLDFPFQAIHTLTFHPRPQPLSASLRPIYRIAQIALVLKTNCRGNIASLLKLQFFNWLLKSSSLQKIIEQGLTQQSVFTLELIHMDPMVNLALNYAFAESLITVTNNSRFKLTEKGHKFISLILQDDQSILADEHKLLRIIGQNVSEIKLREILL